MNKKGCGNSCRISQLTKEVFICGESLLNDKVFYCDDCLRGGVLSVKENKVSPDGSVCVLGVEIKPYTKEVTKDYSYRDYKIINKEIKEDE